MFITDPNIKKSMFEGGELDTSCWNVCAIRTKRRGYC